MDELIRRTFLVLRPNGLPTKEEVENHIDYLEEMDYKSGLGMGWRANAILREQYTKYSWVLLNSDFIKSIRDFAHAYSLNVIELHAGNGWLSYYLELHGLVIDGMVDKKIPDSYGSPYSNSNMVQKRDSAEYVRNIGGLYHTRLYIMSWPPHDCGSAMRVWRAMGKGTKLLYFGEGAGGCTADDEFHELVKREGKEINVDGINEKYLRFKSINDQAYCWEKQ